MSRNKDLIGAWEGYRSDHRGHHDQAANLVGRTMLALVSELGLTDSDAQNWSTCPSERNGIPHASRQEGPWRPTSPVEVFLVSSDPPSFVLPIATASDLLVRAKDAEHYGVLRMVPDNDSQADQVVLLIKSITSARRVAIFSDEDNPVYSINLTRAITTRVRDVGGLILLEENIGPSSPVADTLNKWVEESRPVPDAIIYVGLAHHGRLLADQLTASGLKIPVIFTDGNMEQPLIGHVGDLAFEGYVLSPVGLAPGAEGLPTYEPIGRDTARLARKLVNDCQGCDREEMRDHISAARASRKLTFNTGDAGNYDFDGQGQNVGLRFHVYRILKDGRIEAVVL